MACTYENMLCVDFGTIKTAHARNLHRLAGYIAKMRNGERVRKDDCYVMESPAIILHMRRLNIAYEEVNGKYANLLYFSPQFAEKLFDALRTQYIVKNGRVYKWHHLATAAKYHAIRDGITWEQYSGKFGNGLKAHIPSRWSGKSSRFHGIEYWIEA